MTWAATISPPTPSQLGQAKRLQAGLDPVSGSPWHPLEGPLDAQQLPGFSESTPAASVLSFTLASDVSFYTFTPTPPWSLASPPPVSSPPAFLSRNSLFLSSVFFADHQSCFSEQSPPPLPSDYPRLWHNGGLPSSPPPDTTPLTLDQIGPALHWKACGLEQGPLWGT